LSLQASLRPRGPYSLALTARRAGDATRTFREGVLEALVPCSEGLERVRAWQAYDGVVHVRAESAEGVERLRFLLALDDDHTPFLRLCRSDRLLHHAALHLQGLRQIRLGTVAHSLLRALCGQLIEARRARALERRIVAAVAPAADGLHAPPSADALQALGPARLRALGLHARRGAALVRLCRELDLERLRAQPSPAVEARLLRERGIGAWSIGLVFLEGLGRSDRGLVGDLGLVKLLAALRGGRVDDASETAALLEPYGEWGGLASVYLLAGFGAGLIPLPAGAGGRAAGRRSRAA
jgi:3-methyladenine DNA glycosylase/8-oxoguanine DNA glycosylase